MSDYHCWVEYADGTLWDSFDKSKFKFPFAVKGLNITDIQYKAWDKNDDWMQGIIKRSEDFIDSLDIPLEELDKHFAVFNSGFCAMRAIIHQRLYGGILRMGSVKLIAEYNGKAVNWVQWGNFKSNRMGKVKKDFLNELFQDPMKELLCREADKRHARKINEVYNELQFRNIVSLISLILKQ